MEPTAAVATGLLAVGLLAVASPALIALVRAVRRLGASGASGRPGPDAAVASDRARALSTGAVDARPGPASSPPGPAHLRPTRFVVVGDRRPLPELVEPTRVMPVDPPPGRPADPRRRLLRDASAALVLIAVIVLAATSLPRGTEPAGGVLSETATPAASSASGAAASPADGASPDAAESMPASVASQAATSASASASASAPSSPAGPVVSPAGASARASASPSPSGPSASRLALLRACPGQPDCYLYVVRTGDTLLRISNFFGIPMDTILRFNPGITDPSIVVRRTTMVLPTPTR